MKLPVVKEIIRPSSLTLWRRFAEVAFDYALALGEEIPLTGVRGVARPNDMIATANKVFVSEDGPGTDAAAVIAAFDGQPTPTWIIPNHATATAAALQAVGYIRRSHQLMRLNAANPANDNGPVAMILPGRAARAAFTDWCEKRAVLDPAAVYLPEHFDDPQYDGMIAMRSGRAIGNVGLQTRGQTGMICDLYVDPAEQRRGLGAKLVARAIEMAARGQLHDVFACVGEHETAAARLLTNAGFVTICGCGEWHDLRDDVLNRSA